MKKTTFKFQIKGNHEDPEANAIPYTRTLRHAFREDAVRYFGWCDYVRASFIRALPEGHMITDASGSLEFEFHRDRGLPKPIILKNSKVRVDTIITWANHKHGDADNVHKGILDALFVNDKCVTTGFYDSEVKKKGVVDVKITISPA